MNEKPQTFFVRVENPIQTRKDILLAIRNVLQALQKQDKVNSIRIQKAKELAILRSNIKESQRLLLNIKKNMPSTPAVSLKLTTPKEKAREKPKAEIQREDVNRLERQLSDIEKKLNQIE